MTITTTYTARRTVPLARLDDAAAAVQIVGERYNAQMQQMIDR
jgi:hypothetical protein